MKKITVASLSIALLLAGSIIAMGQATPRFQDYSVPVYYYYEWMGTQLRLVKFVAKSREEGR